IWGLCLVALTGWQRLDPLIAAALAVNIGWMGWRLVRATGLGLMDSALPEDERRLVTEALAPFQGQGILFNAILSRGAGGGGVETPERPCPLRADRWRRA